MIRYSLRCEADHVFDSWFADAAAYETLAKAGQLSCALCGSNKIEKALMMPSVRPGRSQDTRAADPRAKAEAPSHGEGDRDGQSGAAPAAPSSLSQPNGALEQALAALRKQVEENSEYVGGNFATEARRMHEGDAPERAIYGEAKPEDARRLLEDGITIAPLPFMPSRKSN